MRISLTTMLIFRQTGTDIIREYSLLPIHTEATNVSNVSTPKAAGVHLAEQKSPNDDTADRLLVLCLTTRNTSVSRHPSRPHSLQYRIYLWPCWSSSDALEYQYLATPVNNSRSRISPYSMAIRYCPRSQCFRTLVLILYRVVVHGIIDHKPNLTVSHIVIFRGHTVPREITEALDPDIF